MSEVTEIFEVIGISFVSVVFIEIPILFGYILNDVYNCDADDAEEITGKFFIILVVAEFVCLCILFTKLFA